MTPPLRLRPAEEVDEPALRAVYSETREAEMALLDWSEDRRREFVDMQFDAQTQAYRMARPSAEHLVLEVEGTVVGRLLVDRPGDSIHVVDLVVAKAFRGRGIGGTALSEVLAEADAAALPVTLYVEDGNPARSWYESLGFVPVADEGFHTLLRREPLS